MYIYENCLGALYTSPRKLDDKELYCDVCEDSHEFIGEANTWDEGWKLFEGDIDKGQGGYNANCIKDFLDDAFGKKNLVKMDEVKVGDIIEDVSSLSKIKNILILLTPKKITKKKKGYEVVYVGDANIELYNDILIKKDKPIYPIFNPTKPLKLSYDKVETNSNCVNKKIKANILEKKDMNKVGFTGAYYEGTKNEEDAPYWNFMRGIVFPNTPRYNGFDVTFSIKIPKDGSDIDIYVLDEDFCQPYDYQRMLQNKQPNEAAKIVFTQVEMWMEYLRYNKIVEGHVFGEYI